MTIWKHPIEITDEQKIQFPRGAKFLAVQMQGEHGAQLWALVDPELSQMSFTIRVIGTGHPIPDADRLTYIGTLQVCGGSFVFHVFVKDAQ